ncbi:MAG: DUF1016 N-terminal domain-containing protein [Methanobrevibacter sp.]|nr:DUF1016 N-terminal domain-containing protein [Candidatus Methanoflexus mossambicus]
MYLSNHYFKKFHETYKDYPKLSTVLREITWTNNVTIFSRGKIIEEREFYLKMSKKKNIILNGIEDYYSFLSNI